MDVEEYAVSHAGVLSVLELFERHNIRATFFITAYWAKHYPALVRKLSEKHEIAAHLYSEWSQLESLRLQLQEICAKPVYGCRMPGLRAENYMKLKDAGYLYDASLNASWKMPLLKDGMWIIPSGVSDKLRVKNMAAFRSFYLQASYVGMYDKIDLFLRGLKSQGQFTTHKDWLLSFKEF
jgi:hypothetical protein